MGKNFKLTRVALSVSTVFGMLASGAAMAGPLDALPVSQLIVQPSGGVSASLTANGVTPAGSIGITASTTSGVTTTLPGPLGDPVGALTGSLGGAGGVNPLAQVQGAVGQAVGTLGNVGGGANPLAPIQGAVGQAQGSLGNAVGTVTGALRLQVGS